MGRGEESKNVAENIGWTRQLLSLPVATKRIERERDQKRWYEPGSASGNASTYKMVRLMISSRTSFWKAWPLSE